MGGMAMFMTTVEVRRQVNEFVMDLLGKADHEMITVDAFTIKCLIHLMRDYAILTHAAAPEVEVSVAVERLIDYVALNKI